MPAQLKNASCQRNKRQQLDSVIRQRRDGPQIPVMLIIRALLTGQGVADGIHDQGKNPPRPGRQILRRTVHEAVTKNQRRAGRSFGGPKPHRSPCCHSRTGDLSSSTSRKRKRNRHPCRRRRHRRCCCNGSSHRRRSIRRCRNGTCRHRCRHRRRHSPAARY